MKYIVLFCLLLPLLAKRVNLTEGTCVDTYSPGTHDISITVGLKARKFKFYVPFGGGSALKPAVFLFHGYASNPDLIDSKAAVRSNAETSNWYAVLPFGTGIIKGWNGAGCCPGVTANDVAFARAMVEWLKANTCVDENKVFSMGFSNGGFMTHRLACEAADVFAGFAPHSGLMGGSYSGGCTPSREVPILSFHGTADGVVPYFGNGNYLSFWDTMAVYTSHNGCSPSDAMDILRTDTTHCVRYDSCNSGVPVEFCEISGLAHTWSGSESDRPTDVDATPYIFMFFQELSLLTDAKVAAGKMKPPRLVF
jgi:polyhydroxybutyrate depolymerase